MWPRLESKPKRFTSTHRRRLLSPPNTPPIFNPNTGGWLKGAQLNGVKVQETTSPHLLDTTSFSLRAGPEANAPLLTKGVDYEIDLVWGTVGRLRAAASLPIRPSSPAIVMY